MRKLIAVCTIAVACVLAAPAQAHCPGYCDNPNSWQQYSAATNSQGCNLWLGCPVRNTGPVTSTMIKAAVASDRGPAHWEGVNNAGQVWQRWTSGDSGVTSNMRWCCNPPHWAPIPQRYHTCQADRDSASYYSRWHVRCDEGWTLK